MTTFPLSLPLFHTEADLSFNSLFVRHNLLASLSLSRHTHTTSLVHSRAGMLCTF